VGEKEIIMKTIEELEKEFGTVKFDGNTYIMLDQAHADNYGAPARVVYEAPAILKGAKPDAYGYVDLYTLRWELTDWAREHGEEIEDESEYCDWDNPNDCIKDGTGYNVSTGVIC
jgi:hypothetical protein